MTDHKNVFLILDAGGTFFKSAVMDKDGLVLEGSSFTTESYSDGTKEEALNALKKTIDKGLSFIKDAGLVTNDIGICIPGPFDYNKGVSLMEHKYKCLKGVDLRSFIYQATNIPSSTNIIFRHDVNSLVAGEQWKGNAAGYKNIAVLTLGTGLGFSFSINNIIQCNEIGGPLISMYKKPYRNGILEDYVSKRGISELYNAISELEADIEIVEIANLAQEGNKQALETFEEVSRIIAENLEEILTEKQIECLLFGGQISRSFKFMEHILRNRLKNIRSLQKILTVSSIDHSALLGVVNAILTKE